MDAVFVPSRPFSTSNYLSRGVVSFSSDFAQTWQRFFSSLEPRSSTPYSIQFMNNEWTQPRWWNRFTPLTSDSTHKHKSLTRSSVVATGGSHDDDEDDNDDNSSGLRFWKGKKWFFCSFTRIAVFFLTKKLSPSKDWLYALRVASPHNKTQWIDSVDSLA